jgi:hypothetical protein
MKKLLSLTLLIFLTSCTLVSPKPAAPSPMPAATATAANPSPAAALAAPTATFTPLPTATLPPVPTATSTPTLVPAISYSVLATTVYLPAISNHYERGLQSGSPVAMPNFAHPVEGCNWMSVAGQIIDANEKPVKQLVVEVGGTLAGQPVDILSLSGLAEAYGPGGYEVKLADKPVASQQSLWIKVYNLQGEQITDPFFFDTYTDCQKNVVVINFRM